MKPLVESHRADELLATVPHSRALWLVRDPADVARSNLRLFGDDNGIRNLECLLAARPGDWRGERVPERTREVVSKHYSASMDPMDAAALFWWARNSLFFALGLDRRADVMPIRYESLVARPAEAMNSIYHFAGRPFPGEALVAGISTASVGRASADRLSKPVRALCLGLLESLDERIEGRRSCA
jgi:hypothetical protein